MILRLIWERILRRLLFNICPILFVAYGMRQVVKQVHQLIRPLPSVAAQYRYDEVPETGNPHPGKWESRLGHGLARLGTLLV
jgi:hypothetical protein